MPNLNKAYQWAINTCEAENVRYSKTYRNQQTVNGYTYYDCSSFIWYALVAGGFDCATAYGTDYPFTTSTMRSVLTSLGFTEYSATAVTWSAGDIVWRSGHTEMVYQPTDSGGYTMGAHSSSYSGDRQVSINSNSTSASNYTYLYRYGSGGATGYSVSAYVVAAICGCFWAESNVNPGVWENLTEANWTDLNVGYGLGQWTNTGGDTTGRLYQLYSYLTSNGFSVDDGWGQLEFLIYENVWYSTGDASAYSSLEDFLTSTDTDLEALTKAWARGWEGATIDSSNVRITYAYQCYEWILEYGSDASITEWISKNGYLTEDEIRNNVILVYRYLVELSAGTGNTGTEAKAIKKSKWWIYLPWRRYRFS